jgi:hypothetical protein
MSPCKVDRLSQDTKFPDTAMKTVTILQSFCFTLLCNMLRLVSINDHSMNRILGGNNFNLIIEKGKKFIKCPCHLAAWLFFAVIQALVGQRKIVFACCSYDYCTVLAVLVRDYRLSHSLFHTFISRPPSVLQSFYYNHTQELSNSRRLSFLEASE